MAEPMPRLATYADLEAVPEHLVAEIIDGELETHPILSPRLGVAATALKAMLRSTFSGRQDGWQFSSNPALHLGPQVLVPDLAGWLGDRLPDSDVPFVVTPPDWICEVLSPVTVRIDRGAKRRIYAAAGVRHLWLLDPTGGLLEAFTLTGRHWLLNETAILGERVSLPPFDAISFPLDDLFAFDDPAATGQPES